MEQMNADTNVDFLTTARGERCSRTDYSAARDLQAAVAMTMAQRCRTYDFGGIARLSALDSSSVFKNLVNGDFTLILVR